MNAEPDGYTLLQAGAASINMAVFENLKYDLLRDFVPVSMTAYYPYVIGVNAKLPVNTLQEFVAYAKSKPGELNYGSAGVGTAPHLVTENFNVTAGLKITHVPYRGTALAMTDLLGGQLTVVFGDPIPRSPADQGRHRARPCGDITAAVSGRSGDSDCRGERLSGLRWRVLARHSCSGQDAARNRQGAPVRDRRRAASS